MREAKKNISDETRRKISEAMKGKNNPRYGKTFGEATKQKMSKAHKEYWKRQKQVEVTCDDLI